MKPPGTGDGPGSARPSTPFPQPPRLYVGRSEILSLPPPLPYTASILTSCFLPTQAQVGISLQQLVTAEPSKPTEGENVTLTPEKPAAGLQSCLWYRGLAADAENLIFSTQVFRGRQTNGKAYTGRETAGPGCSLHIRNLTLKDSGTYTVTMAALRAVETRHVSIEVSDLPLFGTGAIDGITIGSLVLLTSVGILLYCFLRACIQSERTSSTCVYENMPFSPKQPPWVEAESPFHPRHTYQSSLCFAPHSTASTLSGCFWLTGAQDSPHATIDVTVDPLKPRVGENVTLTPEGAPDFAPCHWYRGAKADFTKRILTYYPPPDAQQQDGAGSTGRETGGPGCSLTIRNLTVNDAGTYTVEKLGNSKAASEEGRVNIMVSVSSSPFPDGPYVKLNPGGVLERKVDSHLRLECTADSVPAARLQWFLNTAELNATGSIFSTHLKDWKDEGTYTCRATNPVTNSSASASVLVKLKKRARGQNDKTSGQIEAAPSSSDNFGPSRQVKTENAAENPVYQLRRFRGSSPGGIASQGCGLDVPPRRIGGNRTDHEVSLSDWPILRREREPHDGEATELQRGSLLPDHAARRTNILLELKVTPSLSSLPTASILSSCFLLTEGQSTSSQILLKPQYPAAGQDVELALTTTPGDAVEKALSCMWFRGLIADSNKLIYTYYIETNTGRPGVASTGRETVEPGCSLRIKNVATGDSGNYTVYLSGPDILAMGQASMVVSDGPVIQLNPEGKVEKSLNSNLKLECTADSVPGALFQWFFNNTKWEATGNIFPVQLSNWADEGNYTCQATNPFTHRNAMKMVYVKLMEDHLPESPAKSPGATAGIIVGCLAVTALIVGAFLYFFLRARGQRVKTSTQTVAAPTTYENVSPFTQARSDSSAHSNDVYETLQHPDQSLYQQLQGSRPVGQLSALS
ncbi:hypothetical protein lerEdw1_009969 [Lerista edwardsae]|nr:hypothetical protein lerEdw1_009969 [Lerista edwardsae]